MDKNKYLKMNSNEMYNHLITDVLENVSDGKILIEELAQSDRYVQDYEFRALVETVRGLTYLMEGEVDRTISFCSDLLERATALELWQIVATNWSFLGNAYLMLGVLEKALECYRYAIRVEEEHDLYMMTSVAYNNIALMYINLGEYEKTHEYFELARKALDRMGEEHPRYYTKLISYLSYIVILLAETGRVQEDEEALELLRSIKDKTDSNLILYSYHVAEMYHAFHTKNFETAREQYLLAKKLVFDDPSGKYIELLLSFVEMCKDFELEDHFYREDLIGIEDPAVLGRSSSKVKIHKELLLFYQKIGDEKSIQRVTDGYIELLQQDYKAVEAGRVESLKVVSNLLHESDEKAKAESKNRELKLIADEAIRHKEALQDAYKRIEMINDLGKKITSSLKLSEVIEQIYRNLKENVPLTTFILLVKEEDQRLRSIAFYQEGKLQPEFFVEPDNSESMFALCYNSGQVIFSNDVFNEEKFNMRNLVRLKQGLKTRSLIFMPLRVGDQVIGVCSIQSEQVEAYQKEHIDFLKGLLPYLSIALNNAIRSRALKREIRSHLETQEELEIANYQLSKMYSMDGLTQISNRRDFEFRVLDLLIESTRQNLSVSIYMIDIDNFKLYNDTYGHLEGDEVLKKVAQVIRKNFDRVKGLSARFGGEEFIGASIGLDLEQSMELADRIRRDVYDMEIENRLAPLGQVSVSVGLAHEIGCDIKHKSKIMRQADDALYEAKNTGKNKVVTKQMDPDA